MSNVFQIFMAQWSAIIEAGKIPHGADVMKKRFSVWFTTMEGNEDHLTVMATDAEARALESHLQELKEREQIAEHCVIEDSPYTHAAALAYIAEKLSDEGGDNASH